MKNLSRLILGLSFPTILIYFYIDLYFIDLGNYLRIEIKNLFHLNYYKPAEIISLVITGTPILFYISMITIVFMDTIEEDRKIKE